MKVFAPGSGGGPCNYPCGHLDCHTLIQMAAGLCVCCNQPAGYETEFIVMHDGRLLHLNNCPPPLPANDPITRTFWQKIFRGGSVGQKGESK